jgi:hypothetical protein
MLLRPSSKRDGIKVQTTSQTTKQKKKKKKKKKKIHTQIQTKSTYRGLHDGVAQSSFLMRRSTPRISRRSGG